MCYWLWCASYSALWDQGRGKEKWWNLEAASLHPWKDDVICTRQYDSPMEVGQSVQRGCRDLEQIINAVKECVQLWWPFNRVSQPRVCQEKWLMGRGRCPCFLILEKWLLWIMRLGQCFMAPVGRIHSIADFKSWKKRPYSFSSHLVFLNLYTSETSQ